MTSEIIELKFPCKFLPIFIWILVLLFSLETVVHRMSCTLSKNSFLLVLCFDCSFIVQIRSPRIITMNLLRVYQLSQFSFLTGECDKCLSSLYLLKYLLKPYSLFFFKGNDKFYDFKLHLGKKLVQTKLNHVFGRSTFMLTCCRFLMLSVWPPV